MRVAVSHVIVTEVDHTTTGCRTKFARNISATKHAILGTALILSIEMVMYKFVVSFLAKQRGSMKVEFLEDIAHMFHSFSSCELMVISCPFGNFYKPI